MDSDTLQRLAGIVRKCIQFQEVTETAELMEKSLVVLNVHYTSQGDHNPNPAVAPRAYAGFLAATQAIREGHQQHYPPIPPPSAFGNMQGTTSAGSIEAQHQVGTVSPRGRGEHNAVPSAGGASSRLAAGIGSGGSFVGKASGVSSTRGVPLPPLVVDPLSPCERLRGIVPVSQHTYEIYKWMQRGRDIAEPKVHTEVRRARKEPTNTGSAAAGRRGGGGAASAASLTSPRSTAASSSLLAEDAGDDRQFYSVVVVLYGRVNFLIQDEIYFREDGALMIIDRFLVAPMDAASPHYLQDKNSFFKLGRSQVDRSNDTHPVIDFSFKDLKDPIDALRVAPVTGAPHQSRPFYKPPVSSRDNEAVTFGALDNANQKGTRKLIVAKNRKGEEEAYEFEIKSLLKNDADDKKSEDDLVLQQLAARLASKYDGEVIRLCNNKMTTAGNLIQVLRNLVANHFLTVQWIDLSNNLLTDLPDFSSLPLKTLYLHANNISDWQVIEERVCPLPLLTSVTCHGNPIATKDKDYKQQLLMRLQRAKAATKGSAPIKMVDFVAVSACDTQVATMYSHFTLGGTVPLLPKFQKDGTLTTPRKRTTSGRRESNSGDADGATSGSATPRGQIPRYQQPLMRNQSPRR